MKLLFSLTFFVLLCFLPGRICLADGLPEGFVYLNEIIPDIELEVRYYTEDNFVGRRINGYERPEAILSEQAAIALKKVHDELNAFGLGLKVFDAYRPQRAVDHFIEWAKDLGDTRMKLKYYPNVDKKSLFKEGYIAARSGHSRGSTVDLTIVSLDPNKPRQLDMGSSWDFFGPQSWPGNMDLTPAQRAHRMLLQNVMKKHGFEPYKKEWWHFSLKYEPFSKRYFDFEVK